MSSFSSGRGSREEQYLVETASLPNQVETRNSEDMADLEEQQGLDVEEDGECKHHSLAKQLLVVAFTCCVYSAAATVAIVCYFAFLGLQQATFATGWAVVARGDGAEWRDLESEGRFLVTSTALQLALYAFMAGKYLFSACVRDTVLSSRLERLSYALLSAAGIPCMALAIALLSLACFGSDGRTDGDSGPRKGSSQHSLLIWGMACQTAATACVTGFWIFQIKDYEWLVLKQP
mmetsp:Transcript_11658/g.29481  ORF Transcript_11658/g.29481 Transcript_11658/m.29481 type:complete len:234 (+) Transcript_11658:205-906(+)